MVSKQKYDSDLTAELKAFAKSEGWDVFGIADPEPLNRLAKPGRRPKEAWHPTKAIICLGTPILDQWSGMHFNNPHAGMFGVMGSMGAIARLRGQKLRKWITDHGYHYDRTYEFIPGFRQAEAFRQAGLGWVGKSLVFINPKYGARIGLGNVATDAPLQPDDPYEGEDCGDCTICVKYCASGAIKDDWYYHARQCEYYVNQKPHQRFFSNWGWLDCRMCMRKCPKGDYKWELERGKWDDLLKRNWDSVLAQYSDHIQYMKDKGNWPKD